jgi:hypothetical protein
MKHLIFLLLALSQQLWAANNNVIDIKEARKSKSFYWSNQPMHEP